MTRSTKHGEMASSQGRGKKLLDRAFEALRNAGFDSANARGRVSWMRHYILLHDKRHPLLAPFIAPIAAAHWPWPGIAIAESGSY